MLTRLALLAVSALTIMAGAAVAPGLADIAAAFPDADPTLIKLILTLPAPAIIVTSMAAGPLSRRVDSRRLLLVGLGAYSLGGLGGGLAPDLTTLLATRLVLGVGVGLLMPVATGLIGALYDGKERSAMMGYSQAAANLGAIVATLSAGLLAAVAWRGMFAVYALALPAVGLVLAGIPGQRGGAATAPGGGRLPGAVYGWGGIGAIYIAVFYAVPINLAVYVDHEALGGPALVGLAVAVLTGAGFLAGLSLTSARRIVGAAWSGVLLGLMAAGYGALGWGTGMAAMFGGVVAIGLAIGWGMPSILLAAVRAAGPDAAVRAMAAVSAAVFAGQFLSPLLLDALLRALGRAGPRATFAILSLMLAAAGVVAIGIGCRRRRGVL